MMQLAEGVEAGGKIGQNGGRRLAEPCAVALRQRSEQSRYTAPLVKQGLHPFGITMPVTKIAQNVLLETL